MSLREVEGTVFNIQHYCIHDGPGIRTNVFVKGCPLRCLWCANPESQQSPPQLMVNGEKCTLCGRCVERCALRAITPAGNSVVTDRSLCTACGDCAAVCATEARSVMGEETTAGQVFDEVAGDRLFYGEDGGLTVTGGEALAHPAFTGALVQLCREAEITTALETCGAVPWETMAPVLANTDVVLYDIKHMDPDRHRECTGVDNRRILQNLVRISRDTDCAIIVRCPIVPGQNDGGDNMEALCAFLKEQAIRCQEIHLLPYHNMGEGKRTQLGEEDDTSFTTHAPSEEELEVLRAIVRSYGFVAK